MTKYIFYKSQETYLLCHPNAIFSDVYTHKLFSDIKSFFIVIEFVFIKFDFIVGHFIKINSPSGQNRILAFSNFTPQTFNTILTKHIWDSFHEVCMRFFSDLSYKKKFILNEYWMQKKKLSLNDFLFAKFYWFGSKYGKNCFRLLPMQCEDIRVRIDSVSRHKSQFFQQATS